MSDSRSWCRPGRAGRGPAGAGVDRPWHRRGVDRPLRRGEPASRRRHHPRPPDRTPLPGGHRPGASGELAVFPAGSGAGLQAIELATEHGWADEPVADLAYLALGVAMVTQGRRGRRAGPQPQPGRAHRARRSRACRRDETALRSRHARNSSAAAMTPRKAPSGKPNGWPTLSSRRTRSPRSCARTCCRRSSARATRGASSKPWTDRSAAGARPASPRRRCGSPRMTRRRPSPCSHPSSTARW